LGRGIQQGVYCLVTSRVFCILKNAEAMRGDGAGAFTIYAVHKCHSLEGLELGKCYLSSAIPLLDGFPH
jgi:hypothetical protein